MDGNPRGLKITTARHGQAHVVRVAGDIDLRSSPELREALIQTLEARPQRLTLDLSDVPYMDSSGVGTLVETKRLIEKQGGQIELTGLQPRVKSVFEITQLDRFFAIKDAAPGGKRR